MSEQTTVEDPAPIGEAAPPQRPPYTAPWGLLDCLATGAVWFLLSTLLAILFIVATRSSLSALQIRAFTNALIPVLCIGLSVVIWVGVRNAPWLRLLLGVRRPHLRDIGLGIIGGAALFLVLILGVSNLLAWLIQSLGGENPVVQESLQEMVRDPSTTPILLLSTVIIAPISEELFFRGMLFPALRKHIGSWPAIGASGFLFALTHFEPSTTGYLLVLLVLLPVGMGLARLYEWRGTLWVPIAAHSTYNLIQVVIALQTDAPL